AAQKAYQMAQLDPSGQLAYLKMQRNDAVVNSEQWIKLSTEIIRLEKQIQAEQDATARSAIADAQAVAEARQAQMKALVESAFQPSAVTGRDWLETSLGVYANKPDEYLRRLRSAVEDANSLWKDLLGGRSGDEAKLYLAQQEEAWSAGQWESLGPGFDQEASRQAIIDSVIRQVESDRTRQAMIASIMSDPRLLALGLSAAEVAQVTGGSLAGAGVDQAEMLLTGAQAVDIGGELTATIVAQFQAEEKSFVTMGGLMMTWISTGLKGAEPTAWQMMVEALFPGIYDKPQQTGAVKTP
ncbi:MAG: hypothetical protein GX557_01085, partial [Chloroflexi bacterium]|nr:hypothetical protein [Chloroflexota bacterium]